MNTKLFVGSLPWSVNDNILKEAFEKHGTVVSAKIVLDRDTKRSRGFGFVEMSNSNEANTAMRAMNDSPIGGRNIVVNLANNRD